MISQTGLGCNIDFRSKIWYEKELSNLARHPFTFDGVPCGSMEGFLQSLKVDDVINQRHIALLDGYEAKSAGSSYKEWKVSNNLFWNGKYYHRESQDYFNLIKFAYETMARKNEEFTRALLAAPMPFDHKIGHNSKSKTVLTKDEFLFIINDMRALYESHKFYQF